MLGKDRPRRAKHRVTIEAQTWGNTPPFAPQTMYRAVCKECGWLGIWYSYKENVEDGCPNAVQDLGLTLETT